MELTNTGENAMIKRDEAIKEMWKIAEQISKVEQGLIEAGEYTGSECKAFHDIKAQIGQLETMMDKLRRRVA